jgi:hypothetical protein
MTMLAIMGCAVYDFILCVAHLKTVTGMSGLSSRLFVARLAKALTVAASDIGRCDCFCRPCAGLWLLPTVVPRFEGLLFSGAALRIPNKVW